MQATSNIQEKMNPDYDSYSEKEMSEDFYERLKIMEELDQIAENSDEEEHEHEDDDDDEEEEEFSFACGAGGEDAAAIAAEDAFSNGQIKTVFPLFDQSLLYSGDDELQESLPMRPSVKKVFVETKEVSGNPVKSSPPGNDEIAGPYCDWSSRKAVEASPEACKKSNSTGFSKIWRLKELTARSNSDGRDAFVFLNGSHAPPPPPPAAAKTSGKVVKKSGKGKKAAASAHEVYLRSKAKEEERRRSYLPYRPELMGFFTNVNGGLTRNVHPF